MKKIVKKDIDFSQKIIHGDCLEIMKTFPDKSFDLVLTDIPYGVSQKNGGLREIDFGEWDKDITAEMVTSWLIEITRLSKGSIYIFCADQQFSQIFCHLEKNGMLVRKFEWLKSNPSVMNGQHFWLSSGELCVCAKFPSTFYKGNCEKAYTISTSPLNRFHPTQKPIEIMKEMIMRSCPEGGIVLDPFGGSCTTLIAAEELGRKCICIEKESRYIAICKERLASMTQKLF